MYQTNQLSIVLRFYVFPHRKSAISNICALDLTGPTAMSGSRFKRCGHRLPVKQAKIFGGQYVCILPPCLIVAQTLSSLAAIPRRTHRISSDLRS